MLTNTRQFARGITDRRRLSVLPPLSSALALQKVYYASSRFPARGTSDHRGSRASGAEAARNSPLSSSGSTSFASTRHHRDFDPVSAVILKPSPQKNKGTNSAAHDGCTRNELDEEEQTALSFKKADMGTPFVSTPSVDPLSALAYRHRLQHGRYDSITDIARTPYAPGPLVVLVDLLKEVSRLQALLRKYLVSSQGQQDKLPGDELRSKEEEEEEGFDAALARLSQAITSLSRRTDVAAIMRTVQADVHDVVQASEVIGDRESGLALQQELQRLSDFSDAVHSWMHKQEETASRFGAAQEAAAGGQLLLKQNVEREKEEVIGQATILTTAVSPVVTELEISPLLGFPSTLSSLLEWTLPVPVYMEVLRGVLNVARTTGDHITAVSALEELIVVSDRSSLRHSSDSSSSGRGGRSEGDDDGDDNDFCIDDVVAVVEKEVQSALHPVTATDHITAIECCGGKERNFEIASTLYRRLLHHAEAGRFLLESSDLSSALVALARSSNNAADFAALQELLVTSEAAQAVPVSVPLYTSLIDAVSRATDNPQRMSVALALYRRLRDGFLQPSVDTYSALIACCASTREPTHAFAFYHEARQVVPGGADSFTPQLYANLLLSYTNAGYGPDARQMLEVLAEAGAPLTRSAFHAVLAGAATLREAQEVLDMMVDRYHIAPTPNTYAFLIHAAAQQKAKGVQTALQVFDLHEGALRALADLTPALPAHEQQQQQQQVDNGAYGGGYIPRLTALCSDTQGPALEQLLLERYPLYLRSLEHALMRLRIDPTLDPRLGKYMKPLLRVSQQRMNRFTEIPPQAPTCIPAGEATCIAVLAPDVLADLDACVLPFIHYYSAVVIPYSSLLLLQEGSGRRVEGLTVAGPQASLHDSIWQNAGSEHGAMVEHRRRRLVKFLNEYRDVIHLVSLEEELALSRDTRRYGISASDWFARCAAFAINLARLDIVNSPNKLYAEAGASIVLVSGNFLKCGRYVVGLKQQYLKGTQRQRRHATAPNFPPGTPGHASEDVDDTEESDGGGDEEEGEVECAGLRRALKNVYYHNPRTAPNWVPPTLAIVRKGRSDEKEEQQQRRSEEEKNLNVLDNHVASELYRAIIKGGSGSATVKKEEGEKVASGGSCTGAAPMAMALSSEEDLDAEMLIALMSEE